MTTNTVTCDTTELSKLGDPPPLARNYPYYRAKTYTAKTGTNPLVAAAAPLFTLIIALRYLSDQTDTTPLYQHLVHEIKAFESAAIAKHYPHEFIMIARYALCATLDETIQVTQWGKQQAWKSRNLLTTFQKEQSANDRFFSILNQVREDPVHYIDILEIMYLCLSLGFEGRYRHEPSTYPEFENLLDDIYHLICKQRGQLKKRLSVCTHFQKIPLVKNNTPPKLWRAGIVGTLLITLFYGIFNYTSTLTALPLAQTLAQMPDTTTITMSKSTQSVLNLDVAKNNFKT